MRESACPKDVVFRTRCRSRRPGELLECVFISEDRYEWFVAGEQDEDTTVYESMKLPNCLDYSESFFFYLTTVFHSCCECTTSMVYCFLAFNGERI